MQETEVLIIGQGLAGTWLSWWLHKAGISFKVIDNASASGASIHSAGLINPVTGRRLVKTWMIDELMPFAWESYREMASFLQMDLISETRVVDFFPTVQMLQAFQKRCAEDAAFLQMDETRQRPFSHGYPENPGLPVAAGKGPAFGKEAPKFDQWFRFDLGWGVISPCYLVQVQRLLAAWRTHLRGNNLLIEEDFDLRLLTLSRHFIEYGNIRSSCVIFCDGSRSATSPFFEKLPFALNKGEGLLVEINEIPGQTVFKKGMSLVPWKENIFWMGSSYQWEFEDDQPSARFRMSAETWLKSFLRVPFKILDHFSALRPATLERRPFTGFHPAEPRIGMLNGLGTKGCSLAPYFAKQLAGKIAGSGAIDPAADIRRFEKILTKRI
jgi:glycine/D-amino acid oxidase-like deaminating enzyme